MAESRIGVGKRVEAYWPEGDRGAGYYPGTVVKDFGKTVDVEWDDGSGVNNIDIDHLKQGPKWVVGQRVRAIWPDDGHYYPATIVRLGPGIVRVRWDEDETESVVSISSLKRRRGRPDSSQYSDRSANVIVQMPVGHKQEAFARLAQQRTEKALKYIRLVQNLADRRNYLYTRVQVAKIFDALRKATDQAEAKFSNEVPSAFHLEE